VSTADLPPNNLAATIAKMIEQSAANMKNTPKQSTSEGYFHVLANAQN